MSSPGESAAHGIQKRANNAYIGIVTDIDWTTFTCTVEFKESPGLKAHGRIWTLSGSGGTLYPPIKKGDLALVIVTGYDLNELLKTKTAKTPSNPYLFDKSDVLVLPGIFAEKGEPSARKATTPPTEGTWLLRHDSGVEISIAPTTGELVIKSSGDIYLGGKTGAKKVVLDGDNATGSDPQGGTVTSTVHAAGGTKVYVGTP